MAGEGASDGAGAIVVGIPAIRVVRVAGARFCANTTGFGLRAIASFRLRVGFVLSALGQAAGMIARGAAAKGSDKVGLGGASATTFGSDDFSTGTAGFTDIGDVTTHHPAIRQTATIVAVTAKAPRWVVGKLPLLKIDDVIGWGAAATVPGSIGRDRLVSVVATSIRDVASADVASSDGASSVGLKPSPDARCSRAKIALTVVSCGSSCINGRMRLASLLQTVLKISGRNLPIMYRQILEGKCRCVK